MQRAPVDREKTRMFFKLLSLRMPIIVVVGVELFELNVGVRLQLDLRLS